QSISFKMSGKFIETYYICSERFPRSYCYSVQIGYKTVFCYSIECCTIVNSYFTPQVITKLSHSIMLKKLSIITVIVIGVVHPITIYMFHLLREFVNTIVLSVFKASKKILII